MVIETERKERLSSSEAAVASEQSGRACRLLFTDSKPFRLLE